MQVKENRVEQGGQPVGCEHKREVKVLLYPILVIVETEDRFNDIAFRLSVPIVTGGEPRKEQIETHHV